GTGGLLESHLLYAFHPGNQHIEYLPSRFLVAPTVGVELGLTIDRCALRFVIRLHPEFGLVVLNRERAFHDLIAVARVVFLDQPQLLVNVCVGQYRRAYGGKHLAPRQRYYRQGKTPGDQLRAHLLSLIVYRRRSSPSIFERSWRHQR